MLFRSGAIIGAFSAAVSFVSTAITAIGPCLAKVGTAVMEIGKGIFEVVKGLDLETTKAIIDIVGSIAHSIAEVLGINNESQDELGYKAKNAEKGIYDFENTSDYIQYLRNDVKLDKEKMATLSDE